MADNEKKKGLPAILSGRGIMLIAVLLVVLLIALETAKNLGMTGKVGFNIAGVSAEFASNGTVHANQDNPAPAEQSFQKPQLLENQQPINSGCPYDPTGFQMYYPSWWYGDPYGSGDGIMYNPNGTFVIWNQSTYSYTNYPVLYQRNVWVPFQGSPFSVCVDSYNQVFGKFTV